MVVTSFVGPAKRVEKTRSMEKRMKGAAKTDASVLLSPHTSRLLSPTPNDSNINPSPSNPHKEKRHSPRSTGKAGRNGTTRRTL
ncbi:hypothetical protein WG66_007790 [Moniliophthora roreri]|nr:hypothetical protein WG66_007790 [Moniliophthora roreri]